MTDYKNQRVILVADCLGIDLEELKNQIHILHIQNQQDIDYKNRKLKIELDIYRTSMRLGRVC